MIVNHRYMPQLHAALVRHHETGGNWATEGAVLLACEAVCGDTEMQKLLEEDPAWQLTADGQLPSVSEVVR